MAKALIPDGSGYDPLYTVKQSINRKEVPAWQQVPPDYQFSGAEYAIEWAFNSIGMQEFTDYIHQFPINGGHNFGGQEIDFYVPSLTLAIRVQGVYFHYERGIGVVDFDNFLKESLESDGFTVVDIDEDMALQNPVYYLKEALQGFDHSRAATGAKI